MFCKETAKEMMAAKGGKVTSYRMWWCVDIESSRGDVEKKQSCTGEIQ